MERDFLKELEFLGLTARLKRLSDNLTYSIKELYKNEKVDIEPSWHLVFLILQEEEEVTMTEIANDLRFSQPAMTKLITRMKNKGYVDVVSSDKDNRKKIIKLTQKAGEEMPRFKEIWVAGQNSIREILESNAEFFVCLEDFENKIRLKSFKDRALDKLHDD